MRKTSIFLSTFALAGLAGCSNLFISYCDRVARGTADKSWVTESTSNAIPFSKASYRDAQGGTPGAVCVTAQGESADGAAGKNFAFELVDANDKVLAKRNGKSAAQPINTENQLKLWGGQHASNKNSFESVECFNVPTLAPYVKVKVKKLTSGATDESRVWQNAAYCKRG